jgi:hypothetical protein
MRFGAATFSDVQSLSVGAFELGRDAHLAGEAAAQRGPTVMDSMRFELVAEGVHQMVGEDRDKQMATDAVGLLVIDRPQTQF